MRFKVLLLCSAIVLTACHSTPKKPDAPAPVATPVVTSSEPFIEEKKVALLKEGTRIEEFKKVYGLPNEEDWGTKNVVVLKYNRESPPLEATFKKGKLVSYKRSPERPSETAAQPEYRPAAERQVSSDGCPSVQEEPVSVCRAKKACIRNKFMYFTGLALGGNPQIVNDCIDRSLDAQRANAGLPSTTVRCTSTPNGYGGYSTTCH